MPDGEFLRAFARACDTLPRHPPLSFFTMLAEKGNFFSRQYLWTCAEVRAGRITKRHQMQHLTNLWETILARAELPPLPDEFPTARGHEP